MRVIGKRSVASFLTVLLDVGWYGIALVLALILCLVAVSPFIDLSVLRIDLPVSFSVDAQTLEIAAPALDIENAHIRKVRGEIVFPVQSRLSLIPAAITAVLMLSAGLWVLSLLRSIFKTLRDGQPFVPANATRLRWIAWTIVGGELARASLVFYANRFVMTNFVAPGLHFDARLDLSIVTLINGLIILVIAEVFRVGTRLDEDGSLTI